MQNCTDVSKDVDNLLMNDLRKDILTYIICSDQYKACEAEQNKKWIEEAEKNGNLSSEDKMAIYEKEIQTLVNSMVSHR